MSQIKATLYVSVLAFSLSLSGCGDTNSKVVFYPESGKHLPGWASGHKNSAKADTESCFECHGDNLDGGISKVSCSKCHAGGSGSVHPLLWGQYAYARHKAYVAAKGTASCANAACHGTNLTGTGNIPSCTKCHVRTGATYSTHPAGWTQSQPYTVHANYVKANLYDSSSCSIATCHGTDTNAGVFLSGPSCYACHPADPTDAAPVPDKHPHKMAATWLNDHRSYALITLEGNISSCNTTICHGPGGPAPSCSGCHNAN